MLKVLKSAASKPAFLVVTLHVTGAPGATTAEEDLAPVARVGPALGARTIGKA
jgi:hypothetical protein